MSEPQAIWGLASNEVSEGKTGWLYDFDQDGFARMIEQAAADERALVLASPNTTDLFDGVRSSCQEAGLSYVMTYGQRGAEGSARVCHGGRDWATRLLSSCMAANRPFLWAM